LRSKKKWTPVLFWPVPKAATYLMSDFADGKIPPKALEAFEDFCLHAGDKEIGERLKAFAARRAFPVAGPGWQARVLALAALEHPALNPAKGRGRPKKRFRFEQVGRLAMLFARVRQCKQAAADRGDSISDREACKQLLQEEASLPDELFHARLRKMCNDMARARRLAERLR
jgi:hypothetical protein